jgi:hypothetical protein
MLQEHLLKLYKASLKPKEQLQKNRKEFNLMDKTDASKGMLM